MHPYELGRTLREHGDERSIKFNHGSLYMVVQQLAKAGFIAAQETTRDGQRPERTVYAITDAGRGELRDWLRELVEVAAARVPALRGRAVADRGAPAGEVVDCCARRLRRLAEQRAEIRDLIDGALADGVHPLFLVEEEYRLALLDAESAFVERFIAQITDPETGWGRLWGGFHGEPFPAAEDSRP